jgi:hypothetical protein
MARNGKARLCLDEKKDEQAGHDQGSDRPDRRAGSKRSPRRSDGTVDERRVE